jgi:excisionase family DNA binding protein
MGQLTPSRNRRDRANPLVSVEEAAEMLGQSRSSLYRAIDQGSIPVPVIKIGGRYRIARVALQRIIDGEAPSPQAS